MSKDQTPLIFKKAVENFFVGTYLKRFFREIGLQQRLATKPVKFDNFQQKYSPFCCIANLIEILWEDILCERYTSMSVTVSEKMSIKV